MNRPPLAILPLFLAAGSCTLALSPGEAQCETAADCGARGFQGAVCVDHVCAKAPVVPVDPIWGCLGHVVEPVPDTTKKVSFSIALTFATDGTPVTTATIDVCDKLDVTCVGMSANFPKGLMTGADGIISLSVAQGFDGFVRLTSPDIMDSRVYVGRPIITPPSVKGVRLLRPNEYSGLAILAHEVIDPTRGTAILLAIDCGAKSASGVSFTSPNADAMSTEFYLINQAPTTPPTATATDVDGFGGFLNLPIGTAVARSIRAKDKVFVGESSFQVLANTISYVQIAPTPELTMQTDRVGKYRIIAKLGQGGMASVFLSVVPGPVGFNKLLVIKLLKEDLAQDPDFLAMFLNEARLAARLNHANVVQTYEIGVDGPVHFLAMDYLDGQPLHTVLRKAARAKMPLDLHVRILADTLAGLHYAHTLRDFDGTPLLVVHRDVSPQNVFVTYDGQVKLVDFGIAKAAGASSNTVSGVFKGKLAYVAPEQAGGEPVDLRADLFSVGVMLWEAIAAQRFAQGDGQTVVLARRLGGKEPRIRSVVADVDPELADICDRAMAQLPGDRFESAQAFRDALEGYLDRFSRRSGSREVGELMIGLFAEEREKIRLVIDDQMKRLLRETATAMPMPTLDIFPGIMDPTPITTIEGRATAERAAQAVRDSRPFSTPTETVTGSFSGTHPTLVAAHISQTPPPARSTGRAALLGLSLVALALVGGLVLVLLLKSPPQPTATASTAGTAGQGERIKLSISFRPAGAIAKLDGVPLTESPFVAQVPRDGSMHRLDVQGPGLQSDTRMVSYDKDLILAVSLATAEVAVGAADPAPSGSGSAAPAATLVDGGKRPAAEGPLRPKTPKPTREIDEKDPYKK